MPNAEYQIVTLERALRRHGVVCRTRSNRGSVRIDLLWKRPRVKRNMRPFGSAMPLALMRDLAGKGFAPVNDVPIDGLFKSGIVAAPFASDAPDAAALARAVDSQNPIGSWHGRRQPGIRHRGQAKCLGGLTAVPGLGSRNPGYAC